MQVYINVNFHKLIISLKIKEYLCFFRLVEQEIVNILRQRRVECDLWYGPDAPVKCKKILDDYLAHSTNWFIKCTYKNW